MNRVFGISVISVFLFFGASLETSKTSTINITNKTGYEFEVSLVKEDRTPVYFVSDIDMPVCDTGLCHNAKLIIEWDALGHFVQFSLPDTFQLTKSEHEPFTDEDYRLLHTILLDKTSSIKHYTKEVLYPTVFLKKL